jgi:peptide/nickel transport system substrate-binding protein
MRTRIFVLALAALALVAAGCGSSKKSSSTTSSTSGTGATTPATGKKGGTLTVLSASDVDSLDPGYWYYQYDQQALAEPTQRSLMGWEASKKVPTPDLASAQPVASDGGKTLTFKLKPGIKYAPGPVKHTVVAADIKYAMERCFLPQVGNGYVNSYFRYIQGVAAYKAGKAKEISGIQTPDALTLVIKQTKPYGALTQALALPCTTPVPKEYAAKYDKGKQSTYGQHAVQTGPYMIKGSESGSSSAGYTPGKRIDLVRNPNWDPKTDFKPAYVDHIIFLGGNDLGVASRKILTGSHLMSGDFAAPPTDVLKSALASKKDQLHILEAGSFRFIALNNKVPPFNNPNIRKAVLAGTDRNALRLTRGGPTLGTIATNFIPPDIPGGKEAQATAASLDYMKNPSGDMAVAAKYFKAAGFANGKYHGPRILMVGDNQPPASKTGEAFQQMLKNMGFDVNYRQVPHDVMYSKFCQIPKAKVQVCPNVGWGKDFFEPISIIDPVFNGANIVPSGNVNYAQQNDPKINAEMDKAAFITDPAARAAAWAKIDDELMQNAVSIPWLWDNDVNFSSKDVNLVQNEFNSSGDVTYTSFK